MPQEIKHPNLKKEGWKAWKAKDIKIFEK